MTTWTHPQPFEPDELMRVRALTSELLALTAEQREAIRDLCIAAESFMRPHGGSFDQLGHALKQAQRFR